MHENAPILLDRAMVMERNYAIQEISEKNYILVSFMELCGLNRWHRWEKVKF
jgi:hypothetical protein